MDADLFRRLAGDQVTAALRGCIKTPSAYAGAPSTPTRSTSHYGVYAGDTSPIAPLALHLINSKCQAEPWGLWDVGVIIFSRATFAGRWVARVHSARDGFLVLVLKVV
jgi:hypothetical protein